jgi:hypothetical protein
MDGLSGMPADGISLPPKRWGLRHVPPGRLDLSYINGAPAGRGHDRLWHKAEVERYPSLVGDAPHSGHQLVRNKHPPLNLGLVSPPQYNVSHLRGCARRGTELLHVVLA